MTFQPKKRFGQNFLVDETVLDELVACLAPLAGEPLTEIGPGQGALTSRLIAHGASVDAIEIDRDLVHELTRRYGNEPHVRIHEGDALKFDFSALPATPTGQRIVGNLPYNISTPLLLRLIADRAGATEMIFMLQKEVADRIVAPPGGPDYGRLSVMAQAFFECDSLFDVRPESFFPVPRVQSSVVRLRRKTLAPCDFRSLEQVVASAFIHRRKMLRHTLGRRFSNETLLALGIRDSDRPETVTVGQFIALAVEFERSA